MRMSRSTYNAEKKVWSDNGPSPLFNPKISVGEIAFKALITNGPRIAQLNDDCGIQMTFDEIRIKAVRAALNLQKLGFQPGNVFGLLALNSKYVAPITFASAFIGCPVNTLNSAFGKNELINMLKTTKPALIFCDIESYDLVEYGLTALESKAKVFTFGGEKGQSRNVESLFVETGDEDHFLPVKVDGENDIAFIVCSSGTTGSPKGVCLTHAMLANSIAGFQELNADDVMLCFSPLYWITGILTMFAATFYGAKRIITTEHFSAELEIRLIENYKVTYIFGAPRHIAMVLNSKRIQSANLTSVKCQLVGGSKVPDDMPEQWNKYLRDGKNVHVSYGFSEVGGIIAIDYPETGKKGAVGRLTNGCSVKIIDDNGDRCGPNVDGEICVKPAFKFYGYYDNDEATREIFDNDGFLLSGDIGHFDDAGDLFIVDRKKDLFKYQGFQVTPSDIESILLKHPDIDLACIVGLPNGMGSDLPAAAIVRKENAKITEQEVFDIVADHFADYYKLRGGIYFVNSIPYSAAGKMLKRYVRDSAIQLYKKRSIGS